MLDLLASTYAKRDDLGCDASAVIHDFGGPIQKRDPIHVAIRGTGFVLFLGLIRSVPL
ncbi:hypothetical protein GCM10011402_30290 [Paracoccus acridae]|uniref:Uncharacterized protein n=1 Tax=Paracoccus acridae TaxID=1795310 RepID=A0ABQ1VKG6_9RHOB|nr:hypothetical protein [Paracoccus acridae]GGF75487.1 hypothetical protein GCM10011402_30290 [Paracoccus acridae]